MSLHLRVPESEIIVSPNEEKYHEKADPARETKSLGEVFRLMRELNEVGISDPLLGTTEHRDGHTFSETLRLSAKDAADTAGNGPLQYTELGPEPTKTRFILEALLEEGVDPLYYAGVDINPTSRRTMEREIADLLPEERINYYLVLFENLKETGFRIPGVRNLVTMLGFEEGNEHPSKTHEMLDGVLDVGDLLLSEMQLLPKGGWSPIFDFYQSEKMRRFSEVALQRTHPNLRSEYGVYLVPVSLGELDPVMVAVTAEKIVDDTPLRDKLFVTNYCLKYTADDYIRVRGATGKLQVLSQRVTGDGSVAFQLSQKVRP